MIAIVDYDAGNMYSVVNCLRSMNVDCIVTSKISTMQVASGIILPGVGEFGAAMDALRKYELIDGLKELASGGKPLLGICLGMQMMFDSSEESLGAVGLGLISGKVTPLMAGANKVPHMCWTSLEGESGRLLSRVGSGEFFYFVHSFACHATDRSFVAATATYGETFDAVVEKGNIFGTQFHPEKSSLVGKKIMSKFLDICGEKVIMH